MHLRDKFTNLRGAIERKVEELQSYQPSNLQVSPDITTQADLAEENKGNMQDIMKAIKKQQKTVDHLVENCKSMQSMFETFSKQLQESLPSSLIGLCTKEVGKFQAHMGEMLGKREEKITQSLGLTFDTFIQENLKQVMIMRKKFDKDLKEYDTAISKMKAAKANKKVTPAKVQEAEQEVATSKKTYETSEKETLELLRQANQKAEVLTILKLVEYWEAYGAYFTEGAKYIDSLGSKIEKFKKYVHTIRSAPQDEKKTKVFKVPLDELVKKENRKVPKLVVYCCKWVSENLLETQGVFRISAVKDDIDALRVKIDRGTKYDFADNDNPHLMSGILKSFLRELPDPLLTFARYDDFIKTAKLEPDEQVIELKKLIDSLPDANRRTLQHILKMCSKIDEKNEVNKMTCANLSTVLAPNILYSKTPDPLNMVQEMEQANVVFTRIIQEYTKLFPDDDLVLDAFVEEPEETEGTGTPDDPKKLVRKKSRRLKSEVEKIRAPSVSISLSTSSTGSPLPKKKRKKASTINRTRSRSGSVGSLDARHMVQTDEDEDTGSLASTPRDLDDSYDSPRSTNMGTPRIPDSLEEEDEENETSAVAMKNSPSGVTVADLPPPLSPRSEAEQAKERGAASAAAPNPAAPASPGSSIEKSDSPTKSHSTLLTKSNARMLAAAALNLKLDEVELPEMMDEVHVLLDKTSLSEMSEAICKFVRSAYASYFTDKELEDLNGNLKVVAQATKSIVGSLKDVIETVAADREPDITKAGMSIQAEVRNIVVAVKELHSDPNGLEARDKMLSVSQAFANHVFDYFLHCFTATKSEIDSSIQKAIQKTAGTVAQILRGALSKTLSDDFATVDAQMQDDMANMVRLTDLRGCLMDGYESKGIGKATDEIIEHARIFLEKAAAAAQTMDDEMLAADVRTSARALVSSFRSVEAAISNEDHKKADDLKLRQKLAKFTKLLVSHHEELVATKDSVHLAAKEYIGKLDSEIAKWTVVSDYFSPPDMVDSISNVTNHALTLLAIVSKLKFDGSLAAADQATLLSFMSANLVYHIKVKLLVAINALEQNPEMLTLLLQCLIRLVNTLRALLG